MADNSNYGKKQTVESRLCYMLIDFYEQQKRNAWRVVDNDELLEQVIQLVASAATEVREIIKTELTEQAIITTLENGARGARTECAEPENDDRTTELVAITEALTALASAISWTLPSYEPAVGEYLADAWAAIDVLKGGSDD